MHGPAYTAAEVERLASNDRIIVAIRRDDLEALHDTLTLVTEELPEGSFEGPPITLEQVDRIQEVAEVALRTQ